MTNLEKYYDKLLTNYYGVNKKTEKVILCAELRCIECMFGTYEGECLKDFILKFPFAWLNKESKNPYEITPEELAFCNMVHTGVLWKDDCGQLMYNRPGCGVCLNSKIFPPFTFVQNDTLIAIEDILNNYVLKESE